MSTNHYLYTKFHITIFISVQSIDIITSHFICMYLSKPDLETHLTTKYVSEVSQKMHSDLPIDDNNSDDRQPMAKYMGSLWYEPKIMLHLASMHKYESDPLYPT